MMGIDPFDQPGVESKERLTLAKREELKQAIEARIKPGMGQDEISAITGEECGATDLIGEWIAQIKTERQLGRWNRKMPFLMNLSLDSLERALKYGLRGYFYEVIKQRKYNLPEMFG